ILAITARLSKMFYTEALNNTTLSLFPYTTLFRSKINSKDINNHITRYDLMSKMRASLLVMGPLLARLGKTVNSLPGGCAIGTRPVDLHLKGFRALGAETDTQHGNIAASVDKLCGDKIYLDFPSVGATENIMMAATLAEGETIIDNAAMEP